MLLTYESIDYTTVVVRLAKVLRFSSMNTSVREIFIPFNLTTSPLMVKVFSSALFRPVLGSVVTSFLG